MCENKNKCNRSTNVDINLDNDFVTNKTAANMLLSIAKFLLFNRNQIPFVYETFHYMIKKLETAKSMQNGDSSSHSSFVRNYAMERQRDIAIQTYRKFNEMSNVSVQWQPLIELALFIPTITSFFSLQAILNSFDKYEIEQATILFGATPFTAKEAFIVNLPNVAKNHFASNHPNSMETISRKVIR